VTAPIVSQINRKPVEWDVFNGIGPVILDGDVVIERRRSIAGQLWERVAEGQT
jgi:hypothetical protein